VVIRSGPAGQIEGFQTVGLQPAPQGLRPAGLRAGQGRDALVSLPDILEQRGQPVQLARPAQQVHVRRLDEQPLLFALRHAPDNADHGLGPAAFERLQPAEPGKNLVLRVLPDAARVEEDDVGLAGGPHSPEAEVAQLPLDELAVQHVHLAAEGLQEVGGRRHQVSGFAYRVSAAESRQGVAGQSLRLLRRVGAFQDFGVQGGCHLRLPPALVRQPQVV